MWSGFRRGDRRRAGPTNFCAAGRTGVVPHHPQTLVPSSGSTTPSIQMAPPAGSAWCTSPANPYSFVRKHHALESNSAAGGVGVVPHPPQILVPSSRGTTPSAQLAPPAGPTWCLTPRKPLFLRPEAPRPQLNWRRRRDRCGASPPANPCSFVRRHHALSPNSSSAVPGGRSPYSFLLPPGPGRSPPRVFRRRSRHNSWK